MASTEKRRAYWQRNLRYLGALLTIWFIVSYGCGILFVEELNQIRLGGFKLGFWFAQQGAIYVFVVLIFVYVYLMNRLDRELTEGQEGPAGKGAEAPGGASQDGDGDGDQKAGG